MLLHAFISLHLQGMKYGATLTSGALALRWIMTMHPLLFVTADANRQQGAAYDAAMMGELQTEEGVSYEDLCRQHIESMIAAAAAQEVQTELAQRVSTWRTKIDPVLKAEETRHCFDIQEYGERIIDKLADLQVWNAESMHVQGLVLMGKSSSLLHDLSAMDHAFVSKCLPLMLQIKSPEKEAPEPKKADTSKVYDFKEVASTMEKFEVSRLFAAMLQLINNRQVGIWACMMPVMLIVCGLHAAWLVLLALSDRPPSSSCIWHLLHHNDGLPGLVRLQERGHLEG